MYKVFVTGSMQMTIMYKGFFYRIYADDYIMYKVLHDLCR